MQLVKMMIFNILFARKHVPEIIRQVSSYFIQHSTNMSFTLLRVCAGCSAAAPLMPVDNIAAQHGHSLATAQPTLEATS